MKKFTDSEYITIWEVCSKKEQYGDWQAVADVLNTRLHKNYSEACYRKTYQYWDLMNRAINNCIGNDNAVAKELTIQKRELEKERKKIQSEKIEYNKWLREQARDEMITEQIINSIKSIKPPVISSVAVNNCNKKEGILCLSDSHYGIEYSIKGLFGEILNAYSPEIFEYRMKKIFDKVIDISQKEGLDTIHIYELGDNIQGIIRLNSQLMKLRYGVIDSAINYANYLAHWFNELSSYINLKIHFIKDSNHNQIRLCGAPKNSFPEENMSKVILTILEEMLRDNDRITFINNPTGYAFDNICGYNVMGIHGEVKNLNSAVNEFSRIYGVNIQYLLGGHKHHKNSIEVGFDCEAISVGSIIGIDDYSMSLRKASNPTATFLVFEEGQGKTVEYTIKLS